MAFVRHPQYLYLVKSTFGDECEALVEELIKVGSDCASALLWRTAEVSRLLAGADTGGRCGWRSPLPPPRLAPPP